MSGRDVFAAFAHRCVNSERSGLSRRALLEGSAATAFVAGLPGGGHAAPRPPGKRLWYTRPASVWTEALPIGNGRLGAMVFGGTAHERLQLNEDTLYSGGPYDPVNPVARTALPQVRRLIDAGRFAEAQALADKHVIGVPRTQMAYQGMTDLLLDLPGFMEAEVSDYQRDLDLNAAVATTRFRHGNTRLRREVLASARDQVVAVRLVADRPFELLVGLTSPHGKTKVDVAGPVVTLTGRNGSRAGIEGALRFATRAQVIASGGTVTQVGDRIRVSGATAVTILIALATSFRRFDDVGGDPEALTRAVLLQASSRPYAQIRADAVAAHRELFGRVAIDLGDTPAADLPTDLRIHAGETQDDPALAALYFDFGRYLLICSSRAGTQPANLQGIWNESLTPPWEAKYTVNINTQMNYWPAEVTALSECTEPLVRMVRELAITGERTARTMYGARGWVCHHNTDLWRATAPIDGAQWGLWPSGGAWLCTHLWDRYDYGRDIEYLRSVYPVMRGAALFFIDTLQRDAVSGALVTSPSISPENAHSHGASVCAGPAMDQQILRDLFDQVIRAAAIIGGDAGFAAELAQARERLAPDQIGARGQLQEWQADWDAAAPEQNHRHVSHLYGLFPSDQIHPDRTPALAAAARQSLAMRGDESTGWATAWRANLWARLRNGEHAHRVLRFLLAPGRTYPNLFDAHPPFQIDGNFGGTRAIAEMLMQSRDDDILLLPALPRAWPTGSIKGLRARGRCRVDLSWRAGDLEEVVLRGEIAGTRRIRLGTEIVQVALAPGRAVRLHGPTLLRG